MIFKKRLVFTGPFRYNITTILLRIGGNVMYILFADAAPEGVTMLPSLFMIVAMVAVFYFLMIRPENKRKKQAEEMRNSLKVGDEITTIGGITGTICAVKEKTLVLETGADRVRIELAKWSVSSKGTQTTEEALPETTDKKEDK